MAEKENKGTKFIDKLNEVFLKSQNGEELTDEDYTVLYEGIDAAENKNDSEIKSVFKNYGGAMEKIMNDPKTIEAQKRLQKTKNITSAVESGIGILSSLNDLSLSKGQIAQSEAAIGKLKRPTAPSINMSNPLRKQQITNSLRDINSSGAYLAPAQAEIADQYSKDLAVAKTASAGQASTYGALGQLASLRRNRAALDLVPLSLQARQQAQGRLDSLVDAEQLDKYRQFSAENQLYNQALNQYNLDAEAAGRLGAAGRLNRRNSINGVLSSLPSLIGTGMSVFGGGSNPGYSGVAGSGPTIAPGAARSTGLGTDIDLYNAELTNSLNNFMYS